MCFNEPDFLPLWLKYYMKQVPVEHLYIIDHGSTDNSTFGLSPANVIRIPRSPLDETQRADFISDFCNSLLHWYDFVAYTDIDEILVADPRYYADLVALCRNTPYEVTTALGMHVAHVTQDEPVLVPMAPIFWQRQWALAVGSMSKPALIRRPVRWGPGFHYANAPSELGDLFLFHLAYCDIPTVRRRQRKRLGVERVSDHGMHHGTGEEQFIKHIESWSKLARIEAVDLGRGCTERANFVSRMFATNLAGNSSNQIDAMVNGSGLWKIPDRFLDRL
jgi:hypothetical protein